MGTGEDAAYVPKPEVSVEKIEQAVGFGFTPRVFLEEIDKISVRDFQFQELFRIFDALDRHKGQLVFDTNLSKAQFQKTFGDEMTRRVKENCDVWEFGF